MRKIRFILFRNFENRKNIFSKIRNITISKISKRIKEKFEKDYIFSKLKNIFFEISKYHLLFFEFSKYIFFEFSKNIKLYFENSKNIFFNFEISKIYLTPFRKLYNKFL